MQFTESGYAPLPLVLHRSEAYLSAKQRNHSVQKGVRKMAHIQTAVAPIGNIFADFFKAIFNGLTAIAEANSRVSEVDRLNALSDAQLRKMGLERADIVRYVFRDRLFM
jgi:uncharacterized protein YjiS (DUF1127 family)